MLENTEQKKSKYEHIFYNGCALWDLENIYYIRENKPLWQERIITENITE